MATDTGQPQDAPSHALQPSPDASPLVSVPLHQRIAAYRGNQYRVLMALLKDPDASITSIIAALPQPISSDTFYDWRSRDHTFAALSDEIRASAVSLRSDYARAAIEQAIPSVTDTMVARAQSMTARDSQRAAERILETVGVLPKASDQIQMPALTIKVVYETKAISGIIVEGETRELEAPKPKVEAT